MPSLLDLATETRIEIFRYVIPEQVTVYLSMIFSGSQGVDITLPLNPALPLLLASRAIRSEAAILHRSLLVLNIDLPSHHHGFLHWLQKTFPSYRANFSQLEVFVDTQWCIQDPLESQRTVDLAIDKKIGTDQEWHAKDAKKAFDQVECVDSKRWVAVVSKRRESYQNGAFLYERFRWTVPGARDFGDGGRTRPRRTCTKRQA